MTKKPRVPCMLCGGYGPADEYHPYAYCMLIRAGISEEQARGNINAVLDHGRKLERAGLPNDTPISVSLDAPPKPRKQKKAVKK